MTLCGHCGYAPARRDRGGYCSWDCHDHAYPEQVGSAPAPPNQPRPPNEPRPLRPDPPAGPPEPRAA